MSSGVLAGAAALAFYAYIRQRTCGVAGAVDSPWPIETHANLEHAPNTWGEALYLAKEAVRLAYVETLGRWHTADLFFGLAYLSQRDNREYVAADIAAKAIPVNRELSLVQTADLLESLKGIRRYMVYCHGMKLKQPELQFKHWQEHLGIERTDIVVQQATAGLFRPAYLVVRDRTLRQVILCVRGTTSMKDLFTSLSGAVKPHHMVRQNEVVLGYSHLGMLAAARWLLKQVTPTLKQALQANPGYSLKVVGHSMGGGTAAMATMMMRESIPELADATCFAVACPACMTLELAQCCRDYVTTLVNGTDIVPTFCSGSVDALREDVTMSAWYAEFQRDIRARMYRALEGSMATVGSATQWTTQNILVPAASPFRSCYSVSNRRRQLDSSSSSGADMQPLLQPGASMESSMEHAMMHVAAAAAAAAAAAGGPEASPSREVMAPGIASAERGPSMPNLPSITIPSDAAAAGGNSSAALRRRTYAGPHSPNAADSAAVERLPSSPPTSPWAAGAAAAGWRQLGSKITTIGMQTGQVVGQTSFKAGSWLIKGMFNACAAPRQQGAAAAGRAQAAATAPAPAGPAGPAASEASIPHSSSQQSLHDLQQQFDSSSDIDDDDDGIEDDELAGESAAAAAAGGSHSSQSAHVGITAVVAAVTTDSSSRRAQEQASAAETVLHEVDGAPDGSQQMYAEPPGQPASPSSSRRGSAAQQGEALRNRRKLYPVGRILHLLPAEVVDRAQQGSSSTSGSPAAARRTSSGLPTSTSAAEPGGGSSSCAAASVQQQYVLVEVAEHSAYGRLKLCRTMVMDHFIPAYLKALDSVMAGLEARLGAEVLSAADW